MHTINFNAVVVVVVVVVMVTADVTLVCLLLAPILTAQSRLG